MSRWMDDRINDVLVPVIVKCAGSRCSSRAIVEATVKADSESFWDSQNTLELSGETDSCPGGIGFKLEVPCPENWARRLEQQRADRPRSVDHHAGWFCPACNDGVKQEAAK